jgi:hypothetical protein
MYEMSSHTVSVSIPVPSRRGLVVALVAALAGAAVATLVVLSLTGGGHGAPPRPSTQVVRGAGFALAAPSGWKTVPAARLATLPSHPAAVIERADRRASVVVRRTAPPANGSLRTLALGLNKEFAKRYPDFRFASARIARLRGGTAFLYTYLRTRARTMESLALVQTNGVNYTLDSVAPIGDRAAATQIAAIVRSFGR